MLVGLERRDPLTQGGLLLVCAAGGVRDVDEEPPEVGEPRGASDGVVHDAGRLGDLGRLDRDLVQARGDGRLVEEDVVEPQMRPSDIPERRTAQHDAVAADAEVERVDDDDERCGDVDEIALHELGAAVQVDVGAEQRVVGERVRRRSRPCGP